MGPTTSIGLPAAPPRPVKLLTVRDVARTLRVSTATVYRLCDDGELPHLRVANAIRVCLEDLEEYVRAQRG